MRMTNIAQRSITMHQKKRVEAPMSRVIPCHKSLFWEEVALFYDNTMTISPDKKDLKALLLTN